MQWDPHLTTHNITSGHSFLSRDSDYLPLSAVYLFMVPFDRSKVGASKAVVQDISGGCGSMYKIEIESPLFRGKGLVAQHRMVKDALKAEIADMHGLTLHTRPSPE